jgi:thioredoxin reductase
MFLELAKENPMTSQQQLPVVVIGAGPIGLAAAANLAERGIAVKVYEAGETVGTNIRDWQHVRIFTTWEQSVDPVSIRLMERNGWTWPRRDALPTGGDLYQHYLRPLAEIPELASLIQTGSRVTAIGRQGTDKVTSKDREARPFRLQITDVLGRTTYQLARAVIDASGTWQHQNPLGAGGLLADGESENATYLEYGMPDVLGTARERYAGKRIAVAGAGYSAINALLDLSKLTEAVPATSMTWIVRGTNLGRIYGGGESDQLPARGALGWRLKQLVDQEKITLVTGFSTNAVERIDNGLWLAGETANGSRKVGPVDRIIVATGQRPNLGMTRELRLDLDPWLESVKALGPLIDPNLHSCGSVPPHGHRELSHPESGFYTIGIKSYGRAPTFLLLTGYEQARSVVAAIAGDIEAADNVHLVLPETGICSTDPVNEEGCCGGPTPKNESGCCVADVVAKAAGKSGCGCGRSA